MFLYKLEQVHLSKFDSDIEHLLAYN